ncbi:MAG: N-formylglutamate amidohydrolase [Pararhizobium sp.]
MVTSGSRLLQASDGPAAAVENRRGSSPIVLVCEHASAAIPAGLCDLGLDEAVRASHAGLDIGALGVARALSAALDAALVHQRFSRLVYDCNRPPEAPYAMPTQSAIHRIAANDSLGEAERNQRIAEIYLPFHAAIEEAIEDRLARGREPILVTIHSFTRTYFGRRRAVDLGILHDADSRLADRLLRKAAKALPDLAVRRNEPYGPDDGVTHTLRLHALKPAHENVMIEIANDLIRSEAEQALWADRLAGLLRAATTHAAENAKGIA